MGRTIWETVAANKLTKGDILSWHYSPDESRVTDDVFRVRVSDVRETPGAEPLPYIAVDVTGPTAPFEHLSGVTTGRTYRQGDPVRRMRPDHAARVSDTNLRTVGEVIVSDTAWRAEVRALSTVLFNAIGAADTNLVNNRHSQAVLEELMGTATEVQERLRELATK